MPEPRTMRILVTEPIISRFEPELRSQDAGYQWIMAAGWSDQEILAAMPDVDVLVCSGMTTEMANAAELLKLVHVAGAGYDRIPLHALPDSVQVANTFHHGRGIAEHVIMVALMLARRAIATDRDMRSGVWRNIVNDDAVPFHGILQGQTVGLLGLGGIGAEVAKLARGMGMHVQAVRQNPRGALPADVTLDWVGGMDELAQLLQTSDILVVAIPLNDQTRGLVDAAALGLMKPTTVIINVARGAIIDEAALYDALRNGRIAGAGLDVWWANPNDAGNPSASKFPFAELENVVLTPHSSGHASITFENRAKDIAANIDNLANGRPLINVVKRAKS